MCASNNLSTPDPQVNRESTADPASRLNLRLTLLAREILQRINEGKDPTWVARSAYVDLTAILSGRGGKDG